MASLRIDSFEAPPGGSWWHAATPERSSQVYNWSSLTGGHSSDPGIVRDDKARPGNRGNKLGRAWRAEFDGLPRKQESDPSREIRAIRDIGRNDPNSVIARKTDRQLGIVVNWPASRPARFHRIQEQNRLAAFVTGASQRLFKSRTLMRQGNVSPA